MFDPTYYFQISLEWIITRGTVSCIIIGIGFAIYFIVAAIARKAIRKLIKNGETVSHQAEKQREDTLISVVQQSLKVMIIVVTLMMILSEFGIDIGPIIAAAGVVGLALGFGGQYLIKDVLAGLFIILENQYRVGDIVLLHDSGVDGVVEEITLRTTVLRDLDGSVHHVPNGEIKVASNLSKFYSRVNFNVPVAYDTDIDQVSQIIDEVGQSLATDPEWKDFVISPITFRRIDNFGDSSLDLKVVGDVKPRKQWDVAGEFRKRLKLAFDKNGIEIPYPQQVNHPGKPL